MQRIKEIDGLRGLSILMVISSHFETPFLYGGINIFFVVTGFLITNIIYSEGDDFNVLKFYSSRLIKLYPQFILSLTSISIIYLLIGQYQNNYLFLQSLFSSITSSMNFYLIDIANDYFNQEDNNLFLHLWAFAVVIQFYFFYPLILKIFFYIKKKININDLFIFLILSIITLSLYISFVISYELGYQLSNYYSPFSKLWQFFLGASVFYFLKKFSIKVSKILIYISILIIIITQIFFKHLNFTIFCLIISFASAIMIAGFVNKKENKKILIFSSNFLITTGKLSFPIYIWHMPIIYFSYLYFDSLVVILLTYFLSYIIAYYQNHFYSKIFYKKIYSFKYINSILITSFLVFIYVIKDNKSIVSLIELNLENFQAKYNYYKKLDDRFKKKYGNTFRSILKDNQNQTCQVNSSKFNCKFNSNGKSGEVLLLGTSHLAALSKSLTDRLVERDFSVTVVTPPGCPYILDFEHYSRSNCDLNFMTRVKKLLDNYEKPITIIYLIRYSFYISGPLNFDPDIDIKSPRMISKSNLTFSEGLINTFNDILDDDHKLLVVYPIPEISKNPVKEYRKKIYQTNFNLTLPYETYLSRNASAIKLLNKFKHKNLYRIFSDKYFCEDKKNCITKIDNKILYTDNDHLSYHGSEYLSPFILNTPILKAK